jgi:hypothetical protein
MAIGLSRLLAAETVQLAAEPSLPALFSRRPDTDTQRRLVADVLSMPAGQIRDPVSLFVLVKTDDALFHRMPRLLPVT